jgi:hypothetical protein
MKLTKQKSEKESRKVNKENFGSNYEVNQDIIHSENRGATLPHSFARSIGKTGSGMDPDMLKELVKKGDGYERFKFLISFLTFNN